MHTVCGSSSTKATDAPAAIFAQTTTTTTPTPGKHDYDINQRKTDQ
jgi:hypothetical protein